VLFRRAVVSDQARTNALYGSLFKWIGLQINKSLDRTLKAGGSFIGVLDIAGFEIFKLLGLKWQRVDEGGFYNAILFCYYCGPELTN